MSKKLLIESRTGSLSLQEGVEAKAPRPGCLGTIAGPCADFKNPTRNGNFYSRRLWENVFKDPLVVESLEDRVLLGELDHPGDRLETKAANACIVMTGYSFNDKDSTVDGVFDILDTPNGRTLKSLLDYGCKIGVSSRGEGDVTTKDGIDSVDEDSFFFVGFDAVALPAVKKAKPSLQESLKRERLNESLNDQIQSATSVSELLAMRKVIESAKLPDMDSLLESIEIKSKELEGSTGSSNLLEDLEAATSKIRSLTEENKTLKTEVATRDSLIEGLRTARKKLVERIRSIKSAHEKELAEMTCSVFESSALSTKVENLTSELMEARRLVRELREGLRITSSKNSEYESRISNLEESLERSQKSSQLKVRKVEELTKKVSSLTKELSESKSRETKALESAREAQISLKKSTERASSFLESYAIKKSEEAGVNSSVILEAVKHYMSTDDIDKIINEELDRSDRYRALPMTHDRLLSSIDRAKVTIPNSEDSESQQSVNFIRQTLNLD